MCGSGMLSPSALNFQRESSGGGKVLARLEVKSFGHPPDSSDIPLWAVRRQERI